METHDVRSIAIVGAGLMGHGIAVEFALAGYTVPEVAPARIRGSTELKTVVTDADVVIEAIVEDLNLKRQVFQALDQLCPSRTILASNSSSFNPSQLAIATRCHAATD